MRGPRRDYDHHGRHESLWFQTEGLQWPGEDQWEPPNALFAIIHDDPPCVSVSFDTFGTAVTQPFEKSPTTRRKRRRIPPSDEYTGPNGIEVST